MANPSSLTLATTEGHTDYNSALYPGTGTVHITKRGNRLNMIWYPRGSATYTYFIGHYYNGLFSGWKQIALLESMAPNLDNTYDNGAASKRWKTIYVGTSPIVGSDQRIKKDISMLDVAIITKLLMSIPAVQYRLIDGESGRFHYGFLAQDVEEALTEAELTNMDFAGLIKSPILDEEGNETGDHIYALRLEEFIPILWAKCQDFERRLQMVEAAL